MTLLNQGGGNFAFARRASSTNAFHLATGDFDGDGKADLALSDERLSVLLSRESGSFENSGDYEVGDAPRSLIAADFNGDGNADLATASHVGHVGFCPPGYVSVFLNRANGSFEPGVRYDLGDPICSYDSLIAADFNGDGDLDIALLTTGVSVLINDGDGRFGNASRYPTGLSPEFLVTADFDGDGKLDLASTNTTSISGSVSVLLNQDDGAFVAGGEHDVGPQPSKAIAADLDGDAKSDLVATRSGNILVLLSQGDGTFASDRSYSVEAPAFDPVALDLDHDGNLDLACSVRGMGVAVLRNQGHGSFEESGIYPMESSPWKLTAVDLDNDGDTDLACIGGDIRMFLNAGNGIFEEPRRFFVDGGAELLEIADFDGNGFPDLAVGARYEVVVLFNRTPFPTSLDGDQNGILDECERAFHRGDANIDGKVDVSDAIVTLAFLFDGGVALQCLEAADANNSGAIDISDGIFLLEWLFLGGREPATPGPSTSPCGLDPDPLDSARNLACQQYDSCE